MRLRALDREVTYFEPVPRRLARNTAIESTFEVARRFRCTMRIDRPTRCRVGLTEFTPNPAAALA